MICEEVQRSLESADAELAGDGQRHLGRCEECSAHARLLEELKVALREDLTPSVAPVLISRSHERALAVMRSQGRAGPMDREFALACALALLAYPLILLQGWLVAVGIGFLLDGWPTSLLYGLGFVYFSTLALSVGILYAAIPVLAGWAHARRMETP